MKYLSKMLLSAALTLSLVPAHAGLITSSPGGTTTTFPGGPFNPGCGGASSAVVAGFSITSGGNWCHDYSDGWGFLANGFWGTGFGLVGDNNSGGPITINLGGLYSVVGGFMNYAPELGTAVITALAADGITVLESYDLVSAAPISTPSSSNAGAFRGIQRGSADIRYLRFGGSAMAMHDITLDGGVSGVPEPSTLSMLGAAALATVLVRRRSARG
ncbi:MAG: PEP-CTERM sorting domain-containing protein [Bryobacterales bacterium]|nr:PEP-CTERM sorting domain-containing protein [Bryobacterales bacterium]